MKELSGNQSMDNRALLAAEWTQLLQQSDQYERNALYLKFLAIALVGWAFVTTAPGLGVLAIVGICWVSEGVLKTFQSRTDARILQLERAIRQEETEENKVDEMIVPMQFFSDWERLRPSSIGLVKDYLLNALRPTVAFVYFALIVVIAVSKWWHS